MEVVQDSREIEDSEKEFIWYFSRLCGNENCIFKVAAAFALL